MIYIKNKNTSNYIYEKTIFAYQNTSSLDKRMKVIRTLEKMNAKNSKLEQLARTLRGILHEELIRSKITSK